MSFGHWHTYKSDRAWYITAQGMKSAVSRSSSSGSPRVVVGTHTHTHTHIYMYEHYYKQKLWWILSNNWSHYSQCVTMCSLYPCCRLINEQFIILSQYLHKLSNALNNILCIREMLNVCCLRTNLKSICWQILL